MAGQHEPVDDEHVEELRKRVEELVASRLVKEEERRKYWKDYYDQLAKATPFKGAERGRPGPFRTMLE